MNNYRKINTTELNELAAKLKYIDLINIEEVYRGAVEFFGPTVTLVKLVAGPEYNDCGYDFRISNVKGFSNQKELSGPSDDEKKDKFWDWVYGLSESQEMASENPESEIVVDILNKTIQGIPDLYIKE